MIEEPRVERTIRQRYGQAGRFAACVAAAMMLAGCVGSGSSSFVDDRQQEPSQGSVEDATYSAPLDVAAAGVVDARGQSAALGPVRLSAPYETTASTRPSSELAPASSSPHALAIYQPQPPAPQAILQQDPDPVATGAVAETLPEMSGAGGVGETRSLYGVAPAGPVVGNNAPIALAALPIEAPTTASLQPSVLGELPTGPTPMIDPFETAAEQRIPSLMASFKHGECKGGWGPKPRMLNAKRIDPAHPYYMEMRLRHTPPLPIGHVYIAYGRIGPDGEPLDEKLVMLAPVGGYAGAALAAAAPMPGVLTPHYDDCRQTPIAAYRVSLSAVQFEQLLQRIHKAKVEKPAYHLFQYNCNHFMSDIAASVGILPPKNIYKHSLVYFYDMMDRNEGRKVPREPVYASAVPAVAAPIR